MATKKLNFRERGEGGRCRKHRWPFGGFPSSHTLGVVSTYACCWKTSVHHMIKQEDIYLSPNTAPGMSPIQHEVSLILILRSHAPCCTERRGNTGEKNAHSDNWEQQPWYSEWQWRVTLSSVCYSRDIFQHNPQLNPFTFSPFLLCCNYQKFQQFTVKNQSKVLLLIYLSLLLGLLLWLKISLNTSLHNFSEEFPKKGFLQDFWQGFCNSFK